MNEVVNCKAQRERERVCHMCLIRLCLHACFNISPHNSQILIIFGGQSIMLNPIPVLLFYLLCDATILIILFVCLPKCSFKFSTFWFGIKKNWLVCIDIYVLSVDFVYQVYVGNGRGKCLCEMPIFSRNILLEPKAHEHWSQILCS